MRRRRDAAAGLVPNVKLTLHDLQQLDEEVLRHLPEEVLRALTLTLLTDLKEAQERLHQNPTNSSRPPSSRPPWTRGGPPVKSAESDGRDVAPSGAERAAGEAC